MIGIGPIEIVVLLVIALIVIGPEKMPEVARAVARLMRDLRGAMDEVRGHFEDIAREDLFDTKEMESYYRDTIDGVKKIVEMPEELKEGAKEFEKEIEGVGKEIDSSIKEIDKPAEKIKADKEIEKPAEEIVEELKAEEPPSQPSP
jgi:sec-independent protein translocase protein TatB